MKRLFIIDTSVVVSGLLTSDANAPTARIVDGMLAASFPFALSQDLLSEYWEVLRRPSIRSLHRLTDRQIESILTTVTTHAVLREPQHGPPAPDPGDQHVWDMLHTWPGTTLVTGDRALLRAAGDLSIISPAAMIGLLEASGN